MTLDPLVVATAAEAVVLAGEMQLAARAGDVHVQKKGEIDLVTEVDVGVERMFRAMVAERFPDHVVLGEELSSDADREATVGVRWIFDPLDGTTNFAHGLPIFCASLALEVEGVTCLGAVYDPTRRELFTAERGSGAFLNGAPIRVSHAGRIGDAMLCTGFPYDVHASIDEVVGLFGAFVARARAVRRLGSAALDLCYLAAGRLDGFWEQRLKPWDTAAGALIVEEAGGVVTNWTGAAWTPYQPELLASNGRFHTELLSTIEDFHARRSSLRTPLTP